VFEFHFVNGLPCVLQTFLSEELLMSLFLELVGPLAVVGDCGQFSGIELLASEMTLRSRLAL